MLRLDGLELEDLVRAGATRGAARTVMNRAGVIMKEMGQTQEVEAKAPTKSQPRRLLEQFSGAEDWGEKKNDEKKQAMAKACGALGLEFKEGEVNRDGMPNLEAFERKVKVWILKVKSHHKVLAQGMAEILMLLEGLEAPEVARVVERLTQEMGDTEGWNDLLGDVWAAAVASCRELEDSITFEASMSKRGGLALFSDVVRYVKARTAGTTEDTKNAAEKPKMCMIPALLGRRLRRWDIEVAAWERMRGAPLVGEERIKAMRRLSGGLNSLEATYVKWEAEMDPRVESHVTMRTHLNSLAERWEQAEAGEARRRTERAEEAAFLPAGPKHGKPGKPKAHAAGVKPTTTPPPPSGLVSFTRGGTARREASATTRTRRGRCKTRDRCHARS